LGSRINSARSYDVGKDKRPTYIYLLEDPSGKSSKRYVGMSVDPIDRLKGHLNAARRVKLTFTARWLKSLLDRGISPKLSVLEIVPVGGDFAGAERRWIAKFRSEGVVLTNLTEGGEGTPGAVLTPEHRAKIGAAQKGRKHSPESIEKVAVFHRGRKRSSETCARISEGRTSKKQGPHSLEHRAKLAASKIGKKRPLAVIEKMRAANLGRTLSAEHRAKLSLAGKGRNFTPEHREKISKALTGKAKTSEHRVKSIAVLEAYRAEKLWQIK
jgi:hypothetical protein